MDRRGKGKGVVKREKRDEREKVKGGKGRQGPSQLKFLAMPLCTTAIINMSEECVS